MRVLGIRFCTISPDAAALATFLGDGLGLPSAPEVPHDADPFGGAVFPAGDGSWVEVWPEGPGMPAGIMLQVVVDDADAWAARARTNGLDPQGPVDAHGERIFYLQAPSGLQMSFQSKLAPC